ncbi:MAG TPA: hypothetical protein VF092_00685 [Longimicrobium sp.]
MAINMQGAWSISVKAKNADFPQRFVVTGAAVGNGAHPGNPGAPAVYVSGAAWSVQVQNNPGDGWVNSDEQIKFPTVNLGQVQFDIQSNDAGSDQDFDDLVLTCSTPRTESDFVVYGHVSHYEPRCIFNPCRRRWPLVIDHAVALSEALKYRYLRDIIERVYPERLIERIPPRGPIPDPPEPFVPLVLSDEPGGALPQRQLIATKLAASQGEDAQREVMSTRMLQTSSIASSLSTARTVGLDKVSIARLTDKLRPLCQSGPLAGVVLRFQEYDRTGAELAGGAYTGDGAREDLGVCATDRNGNYVFRFARSLAQRFAEADVDTPVGADEVVESAPDVIAQVLDPMAPGGVRWESAPYWNVPNLKRIDICVPGYRPTHACQGGSAIQALGNIFIGPPQAGPPPPGEPQGFGVRIGASNTLTYEGRITARNLMGPQTRCAAWAGTVDLFACFIDHPQVTHYTIRWRLLGASSWSFYQQGYIHPQVAKLGLPGYMGDPVGPFPTPLHVDGGALVSTPAYLNIESDNTWVLTHRDRKAQIPTWLFVPVAGSVQFWIEGYNASGNQVPGAEDSVTLYVDNHGPRLDIPSVEMDDAVGNPQLGGDCALFTVPDSNPAQPLRVRFRADDVEGQLASWGLSVRKGNVGDMTISAVSGPIAGAYVHADDLMCSLFHGTSDETGADADAYVVSEVAPASGGWLLPGQPFCTFAVKVGCSTRITDGYSTGASYGPTEYLLGIQAQS